MNTSKIQPTHLRRDAYVYVRQSTQHQVQHHVESKQRQYELTQHARALGYSDERVKVIDDDLGVSASGRCDRAGFERLVSDVALGRAGIVLGIEVSRLARNNRDWYELLDLCAMKDTLIGDADGIYDPSAYNDRLLLGLKGTMSEAELHIIKGRMLAGLWHKAEKGELRFRLPAGYEFNDRGDIVKTSDEEVVHFVELAFAQLLEAGSISGLTKFFFHEGIRIPRRERSNGSIRWETPYYRALHLMVTNPIYAGTYVYGRTETVTDIGSDGSRKTRRRLKSMDEWNVVLHGHHPAYISWEDYERIQCMMKRNRPAYLNQASTALREGKALLQGIVRCGRCGRKMTVRYQGRSGGPPATYYCCAAAQVQNGTSMCQSMGGHRIDEAISNLFLETMSEGCLEFHLAALRKHDEFDDGVLRQLELQLEHALYEAQRFERQYNAVEPENRVVARTLESRWNEALTKTEEIKQHIAERKQDVALRLTDAEQQQLRDLAQDLPNLWKQDHVTVKDRKALIRAAIDEVQLHKQEREVSVKVIWRGGAVTEMPVALPRVPPPSSIPADLVELLRQLATRHTDAQIARVFGRRGIKTPTKRAFSARHVGDLRRRNAIPPCKKPSPDEDGATYTVVQAAELFDVSPPTIYSWLKLGIVVGEQITAGAPWSIQITDGDRKRLLSTAPPGWLSVNDAATELGVTKQTILNWVKTKKIRYTYATCGLRRGLKVEVESAPARRQGHFGLKPQPAT